MSFLIKYNDGKLVDSKMLHKRETPCPSYLCKDGSTFCVGEVFNKTFDDIACSGWETNLESINNIIGDIAIARATDEKCIFAVDLCGIDNLFYFRDNSKFIISDNIWEIVNDIQPRFEDLNQEWIRNNLVYCVINGETFINNLKVLMPGQIGTYDPKQNVLNIREYRKFGYSSDIKTLAGAVESMDKALDTMFVSLKSKFGDDCVYGMGLSGGLDSRVIPYYAKKHNMNLVSWNICTQRPNKILEASSVKSAKRLSEEFKIPLKIVEWKYKKLEEKLNLRIRNMPMGTSGRNMFKYETEGIPEFDIMIGGGFGILVGDYLPLEVPKLNKEELKRRMEKMFISLESTSKKGRARRALNYIFGLNLPVTDERAPDSVVKLLDEELKNAKNFISEYVDKRYGDYTNIEIFESYWLNYLCTRDRNGAFESMFGTRRSFATYSPYVFKEIVKWDESLLLGRQVLPALIKKKMPEIASVGTDSYTTAPSKSSKMISRIISVTNRLIRGNGTAIDENNFNNRTKETIRKCLNNKCEWFYKIIDTRGINESILNKKHLRQITGIWEMKALVDYIETKGYQEINHE